MDGPRTCVWNVYRCVVHGDAGLGALAAVPLGSSDLALAGPAGRPGAAGGEQEWSRTTSNLRRCVMSRVRVLSGPLDATLW